MKQTKISKTAILLLSLILSIIIAECLLRVFEKDSYQDMSLHDTSKRYIKSINLIQGYEITTHYGEEDWPFHSSWLGFRDYNYNKIKQNNVSRIIVLGDSVTEGYQLAMNESYIKILEKMLNKKSKTSEVLSMGISGYSTIMEWALLKEKGLSLEPDMIIVGYVLNDPLSYGTIESFVYGKEERKREKLIAKITNQNVLCKIKTTSKQFLFFQKIKSVWNLNKKIIVQENSEEFYNRIHEDKCLWRTVKFSLEEFGRISQEQNIPVIIIIFPLNTPWTTYPYLDIHKQIIETCKKNNLEVIDLYENYKNYDYKEIKKDYLHPNKFGHEIAAEVIYNYLYEHKLLER